jgi:hypothetical protein
MTIGAWILMFGAWTVIIGMVCYCFAKILILRRLDPDEQPPPGEPAAHRHSDQ